MRKHSKWLWVTGAVVLLFAGWVVAANAQGAKRGQLRAGQGNLRSIFRPGALLRGLDLTDQQKEQVKTILTNHKEGIRTAIKEYSKARLALSRSLAAGASEADLKVIFDKAAGAEWNAVLLRSRITEEIKRILTPEQLSILQKRLGKLGTVIEAWLNAIE